jgi:hypothetical protein
LWRARAVRADGRVRCCRASKAPARLATAAPRRPSLTALLITHKQAARRCLAAAVSLDAGLLAPKHCAPAAARRAGARVLLRGQQHQDRLQQAPGVRTLHGLSPCLAPHMHVQAPLSTRVPVSRTQDVLEAATWRQLLPELVLLTRSCLRTQHWCAAAGVAAAAAASGPAVVQCHGPRWLADGTCCAHLAACTQRKPHHHTHAGRVRPSWQPQPQR